MEQKTRKRIGYFLATSGFLLVIAKAIDYFLSGKALIPFLTLFGIVLITIGIILIKQRKKRGKNGKKEKQKK